ncbi:uncharacterized protein SPPG_01803 [Spizellomyces punctatus DAOM BR117]|uniref:ATP-dependent helicase HrpA n=1 Tax=Spizellomyces punctatus (strain DAOM BR117) TaxID=645134 RepID=A0A0L0HP35_SPIPD|nr:uncharacterized protein SPPG_01803 [Spizellomyces punctatus DAOM BR117]KND02720.1 hypothetical protein SPPG_01803 [Spizellomyces punctatus DAOM BR117]|eukprot:XP_016610759.1 hypothetical protein SPPG_01803 [Spizellomyces punctatus DAOM BR117]
MGELRYNIDGTLRQETEREAAEREQWDRRRGGRWQQRPEKPKLSKEEALAEARKAILIENRDKREQGRSGEEPELRSGGRRERGAPVWGWEADRVLFGRGGEAPFRREDPEYDEFRDFFLKFTVMREKKLKADEVAAIKSGNPHQAPKRDEIADSRHALVLFADFQERKREQLKTKIESDRAALPIKPLQEKISETVRDNRVVLIAADTGAGKSTQVPQYLLAAGFDRIACTQPRRIACYSLARRVSYESMNMYGSEIAYQVRFEGTKTTKTKILFLTEGVLLRQFASDPQLPMYNVIIVDEVHERHMTGDFLLGVLKRLLSHREDIRVILMSATINAKLFSEYFNAPIIEVPGRMYPVTIEYLPIEEEDRNLVDDRLYNERMEAEVRQSIPARPTKLDAAPYLRIMEKIDQVVPDHERGDMLIFVSGINEISLLADELKGYANYTKKWIILLLHSSLSVTEQEKVFDVPPAGVRKCILSTNIAETSVTIDGVRFIIDSGKVKEMGFDPAANLSRLSEFWISQSSAKQRAGRAGRTGPGECYRFYSKKEYDRLNEFPVPEILRMPLEPLLLQILAYGLGDPRDFDFIERPADANISFSIMRLQDLGALDRKEALTALGRVLAMLPLDVVLGKMLILGSICDLVDAIVVIAAALSVQSPFIRVPEHKVDILENRRSLQSDHGDPFTLLNVFSEWLRVKAAREESSRNWCKRHGVEEQRLYEMVKLKKQFEGVLQDYLRMSASSAGEDDSEEAIGRKRKQYEDRDDKGRLNWRDPEYQRRREQRRMLERRKRLQSSGKRKMLRMEESEGFEAGEQDEPEDDIADMSVDALEFSLKHDARELFQRSDVGNLTERDVNLLKLVVCSGLYPHLAVPDEANHVRRATEQVFHTKGKRFVAMHPTSIFASKPELVQPKVQGTIPVPEDGKETLATLHARTHVTEMLCYLELLETTKPYLMNVLRVPALSACLLFGRSIDISPDTMHVVVDDWLHLNFHDPHVAQRVLVLANFLRVAWDMIVGRKLENVRLFKNAVLSSKDATEVVGTALGDSALQEDETSGQSARHSRRGRTDWAKFDFLPSAIKRMRRDWEDGTILGGIGAFADIGAEDVSAQLGDFLDLDVSFTAERLKMQEVSQMFGYDSYTPETLKQASVQVTPYLRYFAANPKIVTRKMRKLLYEEVVDDMQTEHPEPASDHAKELPVEPSVDMAEKTTEEPSSQSAQDAARKTFECSKCGRTFLFTPVETLRHRRNCPG